MNNVETTWECPTTDSIVNNANRFIERAVREAFSSIVVPLCGQTRDLTFSCRGEAQYREVEAVLTETLIAEGIFDHAGQFELIQRITSDSSPAYMTGTLKLKLECDTYSVGELAEKASRAWAYVARVSHRQWPAEQVKASMLQSFRSFLGKLRRNRYLPSKADVELANQG